MQAEVNLYYSYGEVLTTDTSLCGYLELELCTAPRYNEDVLLTLTQCQERAMWTESKTTIINHPGREPLPETRWRHTDLELAASGVGGNKFLLLKPLGLWYSFIV